MRAVELGPGEMTDVEIEGRTILIANTGDGFHAIDAVCTHVPALSVIKNLAAGELDIERKCVTCPWHGAQYDLRTGHVWSASRMPRSSTVSISSPGASPRCSTRKRRPPIPVSIPRRWRTASLWLIWVEVLGAGLGRHAQPRCPLSISSKSGSSSPSSSSSSEYTPASWPFHTVTTKSSRYGSVVITSRSSICEMRSCTISSSAPSCTHKVA
ncbi:MAG: hypothetical protein C4307_05785 [Chloroflexota bacterium]